MLKKETMKRWLEQGELLGKNGDFQRDNIWTAAWWCRSLICIFVLMKAANEATPAARTYLGEFERKSFLKSQQ